MLITFQRLGHANNSSSSHSIIFAPQHQIANDDFTGLEYGWQTFTLSNRLSKERYMLTALFHNNIEMIYDKETYEAKSNEEQYNDLVDKLLHHPKITIFQHFNEIVQQFKNESYYIDHQSSIRWPINRKNNQLELDFYMDFCQEVLDNDYVILGGNDNDGNHPLEDAGSNSREDFLKIYWSLVESGDVYSYKDPLTHEWILSNHSTYGENAGSILKAVFGHDLIDNEMFNDPLKFFSDEKIGTAYKKSYSPYLVDLKINSYCNYGCEYCYTSSTKNGSHASFDVISNILYTLRNANVFEVVLGGGEPTLHPEILKIVKHAKELNFKVGITTKNFNLHKHPDAAEILKNVDSIAFSVNSEEDLNKVVVFEDAMEWYSARLYIQTILGLHEWSKTFNLIKKAAERASDKVSFSNFTLLGYKTFGFGKNQKAVPVDNDWFVQLKKWSEDQYGISIGVDSIIANKYREEFINVGVNWRNLVGAEGKSSCYIDAMKSTISASSFTDTGIVEFDFSTYNVEDFLKAFAKF